MKTNKLLKISIIVILATIFYLQTLPLRGWIVDDAGISFSYARNLGNGYGLVSQPGQAPVEGYSNPLWVFILSLFPLVNVDIVAVVKTLSIGLTIMAIAVIYLAICELGVSVLYSTVAVGWLICQPAFVIWSVSGLENPLYVFLIAILLFLIAKQQNKSRAIIAGIIAGLISLTRPEGFIYGCLYPIFNRKHVKFYMPGFLAISGGYVVFRIAYFGDLFPNPYYKKSEQVLSPEWWTNTIAKSKSLMLGLFGNKYFVVFICILFLLLLLYLLWKRAVKRELLIISAFLAAAIAGYILLPKDWMGEYRYATPVFLLAYLFIVASASTGINAITSKPHAKVIGFGLLFIWWLSTYVIVFRPRFVEFAHNPTVPMAHVADGFRRFENYSNALGLEQEISVLTPDVGGALYYFPHIRIYDIGGLVDPIIARTIGRDEKALRDYIFQELPDFIHVHGSWAYAVNLDDDDRFRQYYVPIYEYIDPFILTKYHVEIYSGDYVRRELISSPDMLLLLQKLSPSWK